MRSMPLLGKNLRILQGSDREQDGRQRMREAVERGETARVLMRNYRPDGSLFWNEVVIQPVRDPSGQADSFRRLLPRCQRAVERRRASTSPGLPSWLREDRLTGLHSRAYFEELLQRDWVLAQRDSHEIGLTLFDIDDLATYNDTFDKSAGDACIRRVARVIGASYRRGGDLVGRWEGGTLAVLTQGDAAQKAPQYAQVVAQRVRDLLIHHPRNGSGRYLTISAGVASLVPDREHAARGAAQGLPGGVEARQDDGQEQHRDGRGAGFRLSRLGPSDCRDGRVGLREPGASRQSHESGCRGGDGGSASNVEQDPVLSSFVAVAGVHALVLAVFLGRVRKRCSCPHRLGRRLQPSS